MELPKDWISELQVFSEGDSAFSFYVTSIQVLTAISKTCSRFLGGSADFIFFK